MSTMPTRRSRIPDPITDEDENRGGHEGQLGTAVEDGDADGEDGDEGEEEGGADPVDG